MNANQFFWDSHWLEIWSNHFCPSMGPNGGIEAIYSGGLRTCDKKKASLPVKIQLLVGIGGKSVGNSP